MEITQTNRVPEPGVPRQARLDDVAITQRVAEMQRSDAQRANERANQEAQSASAQAVSRARVEEFKESLRSANERLAAKGREINIGYDKSSATVVVTVSDRETGETVRQIPPEAAMRITRNIDQLTGILIDQKA
ncbi:MAG: flagellar protein FlaG [Acidibacter sp.]|jgi:flagellar protein FlaG|nr:flagellar protein FlaG [Acidibacter sp.]